MHVNTVYPVLLLFLLPHIINIEPFWQHGTCFHSNRFVRTFVRLLVN